jgi:hypothetical protein
MEATGMKFLYWTPRVLGIAFAIFVSIFALDVFNEHRSLAETLFALTMHLIPTAIILAILAASWRWEWIGGVLFLALAVLYCWTMRGRFPLATYVVMSGPLVVMSVLFFLNWKYRTK